VEGLFSTRGPEGELACQVRATLRRDGAENKVNVHRRRTGASCDYELTVAGRWTLVVTAETAADKSSTGKRDNWAPGVAQPPTTFTRSFAVTCRAAKADYHACSVDVSTLPEPWVVRLHLFPPYAPEAPNRYKRDVKGLSTTVCIPSVYPCWKWGGGRTSAK
jgi:hypothetical protein